MDVATQAASTVGGIRMDQPFKIRRLGHFGLNFYRVPEALHFYKDLMGFRITDINDMTHGGTVDVPAEYRACGDLNGYFLRYAHDHHAFVLYNHKLRMAMGRTANEHVTVNQITWQVGSLAEVVNAFRWLSDRNFKIRRTGRDMPGSNWHVYLNDPDGHQNELYYGIEQIGWNGFSKPPEMHDREFTKSPDLPQISEYAEVNAALKSGVDLLGGYRDTETMPATYDVDGILLGRPFKVVKLGPVNLFVEDLEKAESFYRNTLGFIPTEEVRYAGHRVVYLRNNTEHHSLALYPIALRSILGLRADTTTMAIGMQLANYQQLRNAMTFFRSHGVELRELPPELTPGMDHTILAIDPDGHAVQLYWSMEQIGWDGRPRPAELRRTIVPGSWPDELDADSDSYMGEPLLGPWS
jgi:catechol 2,3-dioxygenase-like lactoylglutathione lyase family enzyme